MKTYRQQLIITSDQPEQFLNLSYEVEECVRRSLITDGLCVVYSQHTTSAVFLENDREELYSDWSKMLGKIVPHESDYKVDYSRRRRRAHEADAAGAPASLFRSRTDEWSLVRGST